jgi:hypothetical protein
LCATTACSTLSVDKARIAHIHKVAVVGFSVEQQMPTGIAFNFGSHRSADPGFHGSSVQPADHADAIYAELGRVLHREMKLTVIDRKVIAKNAAYAEFFDHSMHGWQNRPPVGSHVSCFGADGVTDAWPVDRMDPAARQDLMKALGVDALAVATVRISLKEGGGLERMVGAGQYMPQARVAFTLYDDSGQDPVWRDAAAIGETLKEGTEHVLGAADVKELNRLAIAAADKAFAKLVQHVRSI